MSGQIAAVGYNIGSIGESTASAVAQTNRASSPPIDGSKVAEINHNTPIKNNVADVAKIATGALSPGSALNVTI